MLWNDLILYWSFFIAKWEIMMVGFRFSIQTCDACTCVCCCAIYMWVIWWSLALTRMYHKLKVEERICWRYVDILHIACCLSNGVVWYVWSIFHICYIGVLTLSNSLSLNPELEDRHLILVHGLQQHVHQQRNIRHNINITQQQT